MEKKKVMLQSRTQIIEIPFRVLERNRKPNAESAEDAEGQKQILRPHNARPQDDNQEGVGHGRRQGSVRMLEAELTVIEEKPVPADGGCAYEGPTNERCGAEVAVDRLCRRHHEWFLVVSPSAPLPCPDDRESLEAFLRQLMGMVLEKHVDPQRALTILRIGKEMRRLMRR